MPHLDAALTLARWLVRSTHDAEDVVQDAVMRALTYYNSYRGENPRAWLLQIVRNVAYASIKLQRGLVAVVTESDGPSAVVDPTDGPETQVIAQEANKHLRQAISSLPAELRETLILRELDELSYKDIAHITAAPIGTVMSRLWRARRLLVESLGRRENVA